MQDVNTVELMKGVALDNTAVSSAGHALVVTDIACRSALGGRGVAHIAVPKVILGSTMPWVDFYPKPGQARGVQVDINPERIGLRYPVEIGLVGDVKATLQALLPMLQQKQDRGFLTTAQSRMRDWNDPVRRVASTERTPMRAQTAIAALNEALSPDAVISLDSSARHLSRARGRDHRPGLRRRSTSASGTPVHAALPIAPAAHRSPVTGRTRCRSGHRLPAHCINAITVRAANPPLQFPHRQREQRGDPPCTVRRWVSSDRTGTSPRQRTQKSNCGVMNRERNR